MKILLFKQEKRDSPYGATVRAFYYLYTRNRNMSFITDFCHENQSVLTAYCFYSCVRFVGIMPFQTGKSQTDHLLYDGRPRYCFRL